MTGFFFRFRCLRFNLTQSCELNGAMCVWAEKVGRWSMGLIDVQQRRHTSSWLSPAEIESRDATERNSCISKNILFGIYVTSDQTFPAHVSQPVNQTINRSSLSILASDCTIFDFTWNISFFALSHTHTHTHDVQESNSLPKNSPFQSNCRTEPVNNRKSLKLANESLENVSRLDLMGHHFA